MNEPYGASSLDPLSASDRFESGGSTTDLMVSDFWAWAMGDLRMNTARGLLAEFLIARAVDAKAPFRIEWAPFDVEAPDGTRIEAKASGYSQSWGGVDSRPSFSFKSVLSDQFWDEKLGRYVQVDPRTRVHVWVFALHTARRADVYDPLDIDWWEFRIVPHAWLFDCGQRSAGLSFFDRHKVRPVGWEDLREGIRTARAEHDRLVAAG